MKKNLLVLGLLIVLTFPAWKALRHPGMISGHDGEAAVFKSIEFFNALNDGSFPPRWAKRLNYGLGQPTFTFIYPLPFYLTSAFLAIKNDPVSAYKFVLGLSFPIGSFFAYLWLSRRFGFWPGLLGGLIYSYLPYHLVNVYVRGAIGETVAAAILPLSFWALDFGNIPVTALIITLVILAHPFYALIFGLIWAGYARMEIKKLVAIAWGYANSAFYLLPALAYKNLTFLDRIQNYFLEKQGFVMIKELIYTPWSYEGVNASGRALFSVQLGTILIIGFLGWMALLFFKYRKLHTDANFRHSMFFTAVFVLAVFMMTKSSLFIWRIFAPLQAIQFPWRLLFVATIAAVYCTTYFLAKLMKNNPVIIFGLGVVLLVVTTQGYTKVKQYYPWTNPAKDTLGYRGTYTLLLEETPKWHSVYDEFNQLHKYDYVKTEKGDFIVKPLIWKTIYHKIEVETPIGGTLSDKTHYWPGWKAYIDGKETKLYDPFSQYSHGLLTFDVSPGKHVIETRLTEPPLNKFADIVSLAGIGLAVLMMLISKYGKVHSS